MPDTPRSHITRDSRYVQISYEKLSTSIHTIIFFPQNGAFRIGDDIPGRNRDDVGDDVLTLSVGNSSFP